MYNKETELFNRLFFSPSLVRYFIIFIFLSLSIVLFIVPSKINIEGFLFTAITCLLWIFLVFHYSKSTIKLSNKNFTIWLFWGNIIVRSITVIAMYLFFYYINGEPFEYDARDAITYHEMGVDIANEFNNPNFKFEKIIPFTDYSDWGNPILTGFLYFIFGKSVLVYRFFNVLMSSFSAILLYKFSKIIFSSENIARLSAVLWTFFPIVIMHDAFNLKESFLLFLIIAFLYNSAKIIYLNRVKIYPYILLIVIGVSILFFRTVILFALIVGLASGFLIKKGFKFRSVIVFTIFAGISAFYFSTSIFVNEFENQYDKTPEYFDRVTSSKGERVEDVKKFNIGMALGLGLISPIPNIINTDKETQFLYASSNFIKAFLMFFLFLSLYNIIKNKNITDHFLVFGFSFVYYMTLVISFFIIYARFQLLLLPVVVIYASHGISIYIKDINKLSSILAVYLSGYLIVFLLWNVLRT